MSHQYTIRGVSAELDAELRAEARERGTSLNAVVIDALERLKLRRERNDDLDWFIGPGADTDDPELEAALAWLDAVPSRL